MKGPTQEILGFLLQKVSQIWNTNNCVFHSGLEEPSKAIKEFMQASYHPEIHVIRNLLELSCQRQQSHHCWPVYVISDIFLKPVRDNLSHNQLLDCTLRLWSFNTNIDMLQIMMLPIRKMITVLVQRKILPDNQIPVQSMKSEQKHKPALRLRHSNSYDLKRVCLLCLCSRNVGLHFHLY